MKAQEKVAYPGVIHSLVLDAATSNASAAWRQMCVDCMTEVELQCERPSAFECRKMKIAT